MTCTKIVFKDYLENHNMKVSELQLILNDLYESFSLNKTKTKKSSNKASSRNTTVEDVTEKNISTEVVTNIEKMLVKKTEIEITSTSADKDKSKLSNNENTDQISDTKMSEKEKPNDKLTAGGNVIAGVNIENGNENVVTNVTVPDEKEITKLVASNENVVTNVAVPDEKIGTKLVSKNEGNLKPTSISDEMDVTNVAGTNEGNMKPLSIPDEKQVTNMDVRNAGSKKTAEAEGAVNNPLITTPISSKTKLSKNSKNAITYCMSLFEDYVSKSSCKFTFLMIRCYRNFFILLFHGDFYLVCCYNVISTLLC